jgi:glutathione S-transferase
MATINIKQSVQVPNTMVSNNKPDVKLLYFHLRGRAEPCRLLLAFAGLAYEDERIPPPWEDPEGWAARKPTIAFGVLPVLYWNGEEISQALAAGRFLAKEFGLAGKNDIESAQIDEIVCAIEDAVNARISFLLEKDENRKKTLVETFQTRLVPTLLGQLEKRLIVRGGQFFVGNNLTWADLQAFMFLTELDQAALKNSPKLANLVERVGQIPNIKKWVQSRPDTPV